MTFFLHHQCEQRMLVKSQELPYPNVFLHETLDPWSMMNSLDDQRAWWCSQLVSRSNYCLDSTMHSLVMNSAMVLVLTSERYNKGANTYLKGLFIPCSCS